METPATGPLRMLTLILLLAGPSLLHAQRAKHGDWYHVERTDSVTLRNSAYAGTTAREGDGGVTIFCGAEGLPIVTFHHPPLAGTTPEAAIRLGPEGDAVAVEYEGHVTADRRSTRVSRRALDMIRLQARDPDRLRIHVEAKDTAAVVDLLLSPRGLGDAVRRLPCVPPTFDATIVRPRIVNPREVATALQHYYPPLLRDEGIGDTVNVALLIDRDGQVREATVNGPSRHAAFNEAALRIARTMRFTPVFNGPHRVPLRVTMDITFTVDPR